MCSSDLLINRRVFILHPRGVKWTETSVSGAFPTNAELATSTNWQRVYENKAIRIVAFKHKIDLSGGGGEGGENGEEV